MLTLLLWLPLLLDESAAAARLAELHATFVHEPKAAAMARLQRFAEDEAAGTAAAARAEAWLGDLWRAAHEPARAEACYRRAYAARDGEASALGARGLGDLELGNGRYRAAGAHFRQAQAALHGDVMAAELRLKVALAAKLARRAAIEWGCWVWVGAVLLGYAARSRFWRRPWLGWPTEALYVVPLYALLLVGGAGRDVAVWRALALCAGWSVALIAAAGWAARRVPPLGWRRIVHAVLLAGANVALFYACLNRAAVLDTLFMTVAP